MEEVKECGSVISDLLTAFERDLEFEMEKSTMNERDTGVLGEWYQSLKTTCDQRLSMLEHSNGWKSIKCHVSLLAKDLVEFKENFPVLGDTKIHYPVTVFLDALIETVEELNQQAQSRSATTPSALSRSSSYSSPSSSSSSSISSGTATAVASKPLSSYSSTRLKGPGPSSQYNDLEEGDIPPPSQLRSSVSFSLGSSQPVQKPEPSGRRKTTLTAKPKPREAKPPPSEKKAEKEPLIDRGVTHKRHRSESSVNHSSNDSSLLADKSTRKRDAPRAQGPKENPLSQSTSKAAAKPASSLNDGPRTKKQKTEKAPSAKPMKKKEEVTPPTPTTLSPSGQTHIADVAPIENQTFPLQLCANKELCSDATDCSLPASSNPKRINENISVDAPLIVPPEIQDLLNSTVDPRISRYVTTTFTYFSRERFVMDPLVAKWIEFWSKRPEYKEREWLGVPRLIKVCGVQKIPASLVPESHKSNGRCFNDDDDDADPDRTEVIYYDEFDTRVEQETPRPSYTFYYVCLFEVQSSNHPVRVPVRNDVFNKNPTFLRAIQQWEHEIVQRWDETTKAFTLEDRDGAKGDRDNSNRQQSEPTVCSFFVHEKMLDESAKVRESKRRHKNPALRFMKKWKELPLSLDTPPPWRFPLAMIHPGEQIYSLLNESAKRLWLELSSRDHSEITP